MSTTLPEDFEGDAAPARRWPALVVAVLVVAGLAVLARPGPVEPPELVISEPPTTAPSPTATPTPVAPAVAAGRWAALPDPETTSRTRHTMVWADDRALIFGGQPDPGLEAGLIFQPDSGAWSTMAPSPIGPRTGHTAVWTGREMIVFEGAPIGQAAAVAAQEIDGAAYNPATDRWRPIAAAPVNPRSGHTALWTGEEMLIFGGARTFLTNQPVAAYNPDTDTWRVSPDSPLARGFGLVVGVWTGKEAVYWSGPGDDDVAAYNPATDTWRALPPAPAGMRSASAVWTGTEMVVLGVPAAGERPIGGMALHLEDERWTVLPPSPQQFAATHVGVWTGTSAVLVGGPADQPGAAWTPAQARWSLLPPGLQPALSGHAAVWTGAEVLVWGGQGTTGPIGSGMAFVDAG